MEKMDDYKTDEQLLAEALEDMTPLERHIHSAMISAYSLANYGLLEEIHQQMQEVEMLRKTLDLEDRALLPLAEAALLQLIMSLPIVGDA